MQPGDIFEKDLSKLFEDQEMRDLAWFMYKMNNKSSKEVKEKVSEVDRKVESTVSTYDKLMENEEYQELPEKERMLIWELVKIRENDSPKNQTKVSEQYDVTDPYLSQVKQKIGKIGL